MALAKADREALQPSYQPLRRFLAGAIAGSAAKSLIAPLDIVKIIFQTSHRYFSARAAALELGRLLRTEGPRGLWKGNSATVIRVAPYSGIQLATFDILANLFRKARAIRHGDAMRSASLNHTERLVAGAAAGTASTLVTYPLDMLRARLALTSLHSSQFGLMAAAREVVQARGLAGLYRGLGPSLVGIVPYAAVSFWTNDALKQRIRDGAGREPRVVERLACGAVAGLLGQASCYPLDVVRRRMQTEALDGGAVGADGTRQRPRPRGMLEVARGVVQEGGWRGLYKGLSMNVFKGPVAVSVSFTIYSLLKDFFGVQDHGGYRH